MIFVCNPQEELNNQVCFHLPRDEQMIKRKPHSLRLIHNIIPVIEKFKYTTTIDLIVSYYSMLLDK